MSTELKVKPGLFGKIFGKKELVKVEKPSVMDKYKEAGDIVSRLVIDGDISKLDENQRVIYYRMYCESLGLNPITKPFDILSLKGKVVLYANKDCAAQLRKNQGVQIDELHVDTVNDLYSVVVKGHDKTGKTDCDLGVVSIKGLSGENLANAMMKATTKAKRRLTLSLCGLSALDETEVESIPGASKVTDTAPIYPTKAGITQDAEIVQDMDQQLDEALSEPTVTEAPATLKDAIAAASNAMNDPKNKAFISPIGAIFGKIKSDQEKLILFTGWLSDPTRERSAAALEELKSIVGL